MSNTFIVCDDKVVIKSLILNADYVRAMGRSPHSQISGKVGDVALNRPSHPRKNSPSKFGMQLHKIV